MDQIEVEVRGCLNPWRWSPRLLSLSAPRGVVALSRRGHPKLWHHRCLHVTNVQMWPYIAKTHTRGTRRDSMQAKLMLRICGTEVRAETKEEKMGSPLTPVHRAERFTQRGCHGGKHAWVVRFFSFECLERAVRLLQRIPVGPFVEEEDLAYSPDDVDSNTNSTSAFGPVRKEGNRKSATTHWTDSPDSATANPSAAAAAAAAYPVSCGEVPPAAAFPTAARASVIQCNFEMSLENIRLEWEHGLHEEERLFAPV